MKKIMSESTDRRSRLAPAVRYSMMRFPLGVRYAAVWVVLMYASFPAFVHAKSSCPGIHVEILNIENSTGALACALFESPAGFPTEFLHSATNIVMINLRDTQARCHFIEVPRGTYALAVVHDENMDGKLNTNFLGVPTEGYGFSSGATASMSAPSFEDARFSYEGRNLNLTIKLDY